jgi:hypothetical protein
VTYYIISEEDSSILGSQMRPPTQEELQEDADFFGVGVWVLDGEHYGMTAEPKRKEDDAEDPGEQLALL